MLQKQQGQINKLVAKIGPNGEITVMINGKPVNVMDLLSENGKLEAESGQWEHKLSEQTDVSKRLKDELQRLEAQLKLPSRITERLTPQKPAKMRNSRETPPSSTWPRTMPSRSRNNWRSLATT